MVTSEDRWTCPTCGRTLLVEGYRPGESVGLAAMQSSHAKEHAREVRVDQRLKSEPDRPEGSLPRGRQRP